MTETALNFRRRQNDKLPAMPHPHDETEKCPGGCDDIQIIEESTCKLKQEVADLESRIKEGHDQMTRFEVRLDDSAKQMIRVESALAVNSAKLDKNTVDTSEILSLMREGEVAFRLIRRIGNVVKWLLPIGTALVAFWLTIREWPGK